MKTKSYKGVIPALATPLHKDETIDEEGLSRLIEYHISAGVGGIFVLGSMGEFAGLEDKEKWSLVKLTVEKVKGRVPVLAGASDTGTKRVIKNVLMIKELGADASVVLPPYFYFLPDQKEIFKFYADIAEKTEFPIVIYHNPVMTKVRVEFETIFRLSKIENIIGIKDSSGDYPLVERLIKEVKRDNFFVFQGDERRLAIACAGGADGLVTGVGSLAPRVFVELYRAALKGDIKEANIGQEKVLKLLSFCGDSWIRAIKYGLKLLGLCEDYVCQPSTSFDDITKEKVRFTLEGLGLYPRS